jgi:ribulose-phosphate 3-epimerase
MEYPLKKIRQLREILDRRNPDCELEVDGGIDATSAPKVVKAGANVLVAGNAVFGHSGGAEAGVRSLIQAANKK